jgi:hypothetical protein
VKRLLLLLLTAGCVHWVPASGTWRPQDGGYSIELPAGWMRSAANAQLLATRDGLPLQGLYVRSFAYGLPLHYAHKPIAKGMLPEEAAEVVRDDIAADIAGKSFSVVESGPARVDGHPAFRLVFRYRTGDKLRMRGVVYGVLGSRGLTTVNFQAPERFYWERDVVEFEKVKDSFRFEEPSRQQQ